MLSHLVKKIMFGLLNYPLKAQNPEPLPHNGIVDGDCVQVESSLVDGDSVAKIEMVRSGISTTTTVIHFI